MKIIGFKKSDFAAKDGKQIHGTRLYLSAPLSDGEGLFCESIYMTDEKLARSGYTPCLGDEVVVSYNRFRKPDAIVPVKA